MAGSPFNALMPGAGASAAGATSSLTAFGFGPTFYVDTVNGSLTTNGKTWQRAFKTMEQAFDALSTLHGLVSKSADNANIFAIGDVREQLLAPLGVSGVKIIGVNGGANRHNNGLRWREEATAANAPLLELREQGWELHHVLMVPETGYSAVKLHREETETYPDASHFVAEDVKFIGNVAITTYGGIGIEDYGGAHHVYALGCEFRNLVYGIEMTNASIATPLRWRVDGNIFTNNNFMTAYNGTTHPNTLNIAATGNGTYPNLVRDNWFSDTSANVVIAKGYKPSSADLVWTNHVAQTAAYIAAVPT
jgi:hypothetical protein